MRGLTVFLILMLTLPLTLSAQSGEELLLKVSSALSNEQWSQAVSYFRQAVNANADKSEMFYWTGVDKSSDVSAKMANELATYYKKERNYDKAYLFYKELLQKTPNDVKYLAACAEMEVCRGKESEALNSYQKVLSLDANNLAANIFVGNYYYLKAEQEKQQIENDYKKISTPTRMQYARYREGLSQVLATGYIKARGYLERVINQFPSVGVKNTLDRIKVIEKEVNR